MPNQHMSNSVSTIQASNPAAILEGFRRNPSCAGISWVITTEYMIPLINGGGLQDFTSAVFNKHRKFVARVKPLENGGRISPHEYIAYFENIDHKSSTTTSVTISVDYWRLDGSYNGSNTLMLRRNGIILSTATWTNSPNTTYFNNFEDTGGYWNTTGDGLEPGYTYEYTVELDGVLKKTENYCTKPNPPSEVGYFPDDEDNVYVYFIPDRDFPAEGQWQTDVLSSYSELSASNQYVSVGGSSVDGGTVDIEVRARTSNCSGYFTGLERSSVTTLTAYTGKR
ncbi:uncharacterized protein LOC134853489 [Symsagittifera roscoffensis]|uniref:uncharacterized protein LOC134853489 n=1 Tax=Symsagittifera roscoffensis TaxID=84072 RepID=UPI00307CABB7